MRKFRLNFEQISHFLAFLLKKNKITKIYIHLPEDPVFSTR
jgi:hypothetical protein